VCVYVCVCVCVCGCACVHMYYNIILYVKIGVVTGSYQGHDTVEGGGSLYG